MSDTNAEKHRHIGIMINTGRNVLINLDPRLENVLVPERFTNQECLRLIVGLNMAKKIPDLDVGQNGILCTLSFSGSGFQCFVPWEAISDVCFDGDVTGYSWRPFFQKSSWQQAPAVAAKPSPKTGRPQLRLIQGGKA